MPLLSKSRRPLLAAALLLGAATLAACGTSAPEDALGNRLDGSTTAPEGAAPQGTTTAPTAETLPPETPTTTAPPRPDDIPVTPADAPDCRTPEDAAAVTTAPETAMPEDAAAAPFAVDVIPGCGDVVTDQSAVSVNYRVRSATTGEEQDQSFGQAPFELDLAAGGSISGFAYGLEGMRAGGQRTLVLPPEYGYGDDTLVFDLVLLSVS